MATKEETFDQVPDGQELFEGTEPEAPKEEPKAEEAKPEEAEATEDRTRDDKGRVVKAEAEEETVEAEAETEAEPEATEEQTEKPEDNQDRIPPWRLKEEADNRRHWQEKAEAEAQARAQVEQKLWAMQGQLQQHQAPQTQQEPVDLFQDPEGWAKSQEQTFDQRLRAVEGNFSLRLAKATHKDLFDDAWGEMLNRSQSGDDSMRQQVLNSADPGETLVGLYKQAKIYKEADGDLSAYLERQKQEWLKDPQIQAQVLEAAKQTATQSTQPKTQVKLPQSLNKAGSSGKPSNQGDASDAGLWEHTLG